jgi:hypothetical protein
MRDAIFYLLSSAALANAGIAAAESALLDAKAETVSIPVARLAAGNEYIALPALEFKLTIDAACPAGASVESLSISVADTRRTLNGKTIDGAVETTLSLPRRQSARLRIEDFCRQDDEPQASESLLVADVFTARLSLRCAVDEKHSIVYSTLPLDVKLECAAETKPDDGQDDSSSDPAVSL